MLSAVTMLRNRRLVTRVTPLVAVVMVLALGWTMIASTSNLEEDIVTRKRSQLTESACPWRFKGYRNEIFQKAPQHSLLDKNQNRKHMNDSKVLILTTLSSSEKYLNNYFSLLCNLTYSHDLISIGLGEDSSNDNTYQTSIEIAQKLNSHFRRIDVIKLPDSRNLIPPLHKHDVELQLQRRKHLAHARNRLLFSSLRDEDFVLWMDSDLAFIPPDLIEHLLSGKTDITVPSCMFYDRKVSRLALYDRNTWQETPESLGELSYLRDEYLMLEGYSPTQRRYLPELEEQGSIVPLDGIGGCAILVKADCHRAGLVFPPFVFDNHIETEAMAKMAKKMGFKVSGFPRLKVFHT